jgi:hypothetical protein
MTGWMSERFAREQRLQGPNGYIRDMLEPSRSEDDQAAAGAMFARMAGDWGLEVQDYDLGDESEPLDQPTDPE